MCLKTIPIVFVIIIPTGSSTPNTEPSCSTGIRRKRDSPHSLIDEQEFGYHQTACKTSEIHLLFENSLTIASRIVKFL